MKDFARWLPEILTVKTYEAFPSELWLIKEDRQVQPLEYLGLCYLVEKSLTSLKTRNYEYRLMEQVCIRNKIWNATFDQRHAALKKVLG